MGKGVTVEDALRLSVGAGDDVADCPQRRRLHFDVLVREKRHQTRDDSAVDDHLDLLVAAVCQVAQRPYRVYQDLKTKDSLEY